MRPAWIQKLKLTPSQWRDLRVVVIWTLVGVLLVVGGLQILERDDDAKSGEATAAASAAPEPMEWRKFRIYPSFFRNYDLASAEADPFAGLGSSTPIPAKTSVRDMLEDYGITFGPEAKAIHLGNELHIYNTTSQQDLVEAIFASCRLGSTSSLGYQLRIYRVKGGLQEGARPKFATIQDWCQDGRASLETLLSSTSQVGGSFRFQGGHLPDVEDVANGALDQLPGGTLLEVEGQLGPDQQVVEANLHFYSYGSQSMPWDLRQEFGLVDGETKLIRVIQSPESDSADLIYLTIHIIPGPA